ncbi:MAG: PIN domain-containing protein [Thermoproteus sp.]
MSEAVVDTNALVYYIVEDSPNHLEAVEKLDALESWHLPTVVVHELAWFFKKAAPDRGAEILKALLDYKKVVVHCEDLPVLRRATTAGLAHYNDFVILHTAKKLGLPIVTFDIKMRKRAEALGVPII